MEDHTRPTKHLTSVPRKESQAGINTMQPAVSGSDADLDRRPQSGSDPIDQLERVVLEIVRNNEPVVDDVVHSTLFYAEVFTVYHYRRRLTLAEFQPHVGGCYSEDVENVLTEHAEIEAARTIRSGDRTIEYRVDTVPDTYDTVARVLDAVTEELSTWSRRELDTFCKNSWLFQHTEFGETMEFDEFNRTIRQDETAGSRLQERLPQPVEVDPEELYPL